MVGYEIFSLQEVKNQYNGRKEGGEWREIKQFGGYKSN